MTETAPFHPIHQRMKQPPPRGNSSAVSLTSPSTSSSSITSGDSLPTLPFELVVDILTRLPVKFLMQLRSVCKSWKSLISNPDFGKKHLRVSTTRHRVLLIFSEPSPEFVITTYPLYSVSTEVTPTATQLDYPFGNRHRLDHIVGSCHGIICIKRYRSYVVVLWNPSIRKFTTLPSLEYLQKIKRVYSFGFGYDHSTDTYKVIVVFGIKCHNGVNIVKTQANVHTMGTNYWRSIHAHFPTLIPSIRSKFVSGTINWFALNKPHSTRVIVSLDLETESYRELLQPDYGVVVVVSSTLDVLMECLCIVSHNHNFSDVWLMKEYGNEDSWTKLFRVPNMGGVDSGIYTRVLHVYEDDIVLLRGSRLLLGVYNSRDDTFQILEIQNTDYCMVPQVYQESLISPCS